MNLNWILPDKADKSIPLALALLVLTANCTLSRLAHAQVPKVTASEVVDRETLKSFVLWAESVFASVDNIDDGSALIQEFRIEGGDYKSGNMFTILFSTEGHVFLHGKDPNLDGKQAINVVDDQGKQVIREMLTTGAVDGGGFVEWCWDDPADRSDVLCKDSYAIQYYSQVAGVDFVLVGGYYQDLTHAGEPLPDIPLPAVAAADVVDRETLRQFVEGTVVWLEELLDLVGFARANEWKGVLREDGGHFRSGPIYLFIFTPSTYVLFHGANPWREGRIGTDTVDINGTPFVEQIIEVAQAGGGFVEYFWDDPTVQGDEDIGSPKVSYAKSFTSNYDFFPGEEFIVGAGFYRNFSTAEAEQAAEDWLHRFGRSVASQTMELIGDRLTKPDYADNQIAIAGRSFDVGNLRGGPHRSSGQALAHLGTFLSRAGSAVHTGNGARSLARAYLPHSANAFIDGTSFSVSPGVSANGANYSIWGGGELMRFSNSGGDGFGNGEVMTAALGADFVLGSAIGGLAVTHSRGSGRFELGRPGDDDFGDVSTTLTSGFPYVRVSVSDRIYTWGVLGYGSGQLGIEGGGERDPDSDISMLMGGVAANAEIIQPEDAHGFDLAIRADAFVSNMNSEAVEGRSELNINSSRVRLMLEGSTGMAMGASTIRPNLRIAMRHDGGGVDAGLGMEVGGKVIFINNHLGLTIQTHGRRLIVHEVDGYSEWGFGGLLSLNPGGGGDGLSISLRPSWGSTATRASRLWAAGATAVVPERTGYGIARRGIDAEIAYGMETLEGDGVFTPYVRVVSSEPFSGGWLGEDALAARTGQNPVAMANRSVLGYQLGSRMRLGRGVAAGIEVGRNTWPHVLDRGYLATVSLSVR